MAEFGYQAVNGAGDTVEGTLEATDRRTAIHSLYQQGYYVRQLQTCLSGSATGISNISEVQDKAPQEKGAGEIAWPFSSGRIKQKDVLSIMAQLSTALRAGLPLLNGLQIIYEQQNTPRLKRLLEDLIQSVHSGESFSDAMAKHPKVFGSLSRAMVRVGETGGILDQTSTELVNLLVRDQQIRTRIKNASAYPLFVLGLGFVSVVIVVTWILPNLLSTMSGGTAILPWPTRLLLALSEYIQHYGWLLLILAVGGIGVFKKWGSSATGRLMWDRFKLRLPVFGNVVRTIAVGRFTRTLGALTRGGVGILESLHVVRDTLGNEYLAKHIDAAAEQVRIGTSLSDALKTSGDFPLLLIQIVGMGEQSGKLDEMLENAAQTFEADADAAVSRFMALLPGILILLLALIIGFIVAATLLPVIVMELGAMGVE